MARAPSPPGWTRSWSSRKSAPSSSRSFSRRCTLWAARRASSARRMSGGAALLPSHGELSPAMVGAAIFARLARLGVDVSRHAPRLEMLQAYSAAAMPVPALRRSAFFCSGCPHNTSTRVPEGSRALAGTGCHSMAMSIPARSTQTLTQMGGEGANWIGQAPFTTDGHVFVNLGDGTYSHSGLLAIRAAAAAAVNVTYKILYNDAVAMTGGQATDAHLSVAQIAHQVAAEGAGRVVVLAEDVSRHDRRDFPARAEILDRRDVDRIQRELRQQPGLTVIIYDQVCAAEKRRRRKRKLYPQAPKRVFINDEVCEACGDCSVQSNCISVVARQTPLGPKRMIDQSSCNADYSCVKGFCPSFVTVHGATPRLRQPEADAFDAAALAMPAVPALGRPYNILVTGIGGTGVITIGALLGMAAHLEGKSASVLDFTGLSQKNGSVTSQVRLAARQSDLGAPRIVAGAADLLLACDIVVAVNPAQLSRLRAGRTLAVVNTHVQPPADFVLDPDLALDGADMLRTIARLVGDKAVTAIDATHIAERLVGDSLFANIFLLGFAWQRGAIPLGLPSILRAIELNGAGVEKSKRAFSLGRLAATDPKRLEAPPADEGTSDAPDIDALIADRHARLVRYQDSRYAARYESLLDAAGAAERGAGISDRRLTAATARGFYKLMAYKDEYEVARLYSDGDFGRKLNEQFENIGRLEIHLSPPLLAPRDPATGVPRKIAFGSWVLVLFRVLARLKFLRGTPFDIFGYTAERRTERRLIDDYERALREALPRLSTENVDAAVALAEIPQAIRGYGHIKERSIARAMPQLAELSARLSDERSTAKTFSREPA
ncbi:MAG: indolepyruvate ferredoxin oxidoreductase family protein [Rhizomicrobium sp.]